MSLFPNHHKTATHLIVPAETSTISVEHPCIVKNVDKGIDMIGGPTAIAQALDDPSRTFALSFHPQDPAAKTILATKKDAHNILLQITVPKRTGRKRKRGSDEPWIDDPHCSKQDATNLLQAMRDNPSSYHVNAVSQIPSTHVWRSMPDFVYSTSQAKILQDVKSQILSQNYQRIKQFELPRTYGLEDTTTLPPPTWSNANVPQGYAYRQTPTMTIANDPLTGKVLVKNTAPAPRIFSHQVQWDTVDYPTTPMAGIPPLEAESRTYKATVVALQRLFEQRPIWTRRAMLNSLESNLSSFNVVRFCVAHVAYAARSGPWRDTYIKLGVDPRTDPKYRKYQAIMLQLIPRTGNSKILAPTDPAKKPQRKIDDQTGKAADNETDQVDVLRERRKREYKETYARYWSKSDNVTSHIFDGVSALPPDGKVWQLCDITDPQIAALRDIDDAYIRTTCERKAFGWYMNGTAAKMRIALKAKVDALRDGNGLDPALLEDFLKLPERVGFDQTKPDAIQPLDNVAVDSSAGPIEAQEAVEADLRDETPSAYLGENATKQQLEWATTYRSVARNEEGVQPIHGTNKPAAWLKGKTPKEAKPKAKQRKPYMSKKMKAALAQSAANEEEPIDLDAATPEQGQDEDEPELEDGEEILPSIEVNNFDEEEEDSDLGLEEDPEIKVEDEDDDEGYE